MQTQIHHSIIRTLRPLAAFAFVIVPSLASAETLTFSGPLVTTRAAFTAAAGCELKTETFDSFASGSIISTLPGVDAVMTPEDANGNVIGLPVVLGGTRITAPNWTVNFGNGRPFWSPWVVRPIDGEAIYAFGQANGQGDWVRIEGFDAKNRLVVTVDAQPIGNAFAGFVTDVPILRVVVTPLGNGDGANGLDDLQVSIVPPKDCQSDLNADGVVDAADLALLLGAWGSPEADFTCDSTTDAADLAVLLGSWGSC